MSYTGSSGFGLEDVWGRMTIRQRRASIAAASANDDAASAIPFSKPDCGSRTTQSKTLYEIAAERRVLLQLDAHQIAVDGMGHEADTKGGTKLEKNAASKSENPPLDKVATCEKRRLYKQQESSSGLSHPDTHGF